MQIPHVVWLFLLVPAVYLFGVRQAKRIVGCLSDHSVHYFLATVIREGRHRLFTRVPRLLNESHCGAYPLFLHWILSFLTRRQIDRVALRLNAAVNAALVVMLYASVSHNIPEATSPGILPAAICVLYILTPQLHHALSARNCGISARPVGILLVTVYLLLMYPVDGTDPGGFAILAALCVGYLIWGFSTFAQQALLLVSLFYLILTGSPRMVLVFLASMIVFLIVNGRYAASYLKNTVSFIRAYAVELSPLYVLKMRYSIWRDLVWDIWKALRRSPEEGLKYAYGNSVLIVCLLNPLAIVAAVRYFDLPAEAPGFVTYCARLSLCGAVMFLLTSFRPTRFFGEPERYIEFTTPFSSVVSAWSIVRAGEMWIFWAIVTLFIVANVVQSKIVEKIGVRIQGKYTDFQDIIDAIHGRMRPEQVRFCSNNEEITKFLMTNPWSFARLWTADQRYGGYRLSDLYEKYPVILREPLESIIRQYFINFCLLEKQYYSTIFEDGGAPGMRAEVVLDTERFRLYKIEPSARAAQWGATSDA
jgi:hypothetical protein